MSRGMTPSTGTFPPDFLFGAATAAYQVEGAASEDGRRPSIWDTFSHTSGKTAHGDNGDVACDHYHRWREDVALMRQLRLGAYRFSVSWSRILPAGRGAVNQAGLDFYSRLVDHLLEAGITPFVTLYHWDLPQALQNEGDGWRRREVIDDFAHYAAIVSRALGDRVRHWTTFNEPAVFTWGGYVTGEDAPGHCENPAAALEAIHHVLLAHGVASRVLRANVPGAQVGIVLDLNVARPASGAPEDIVAASRFDGYQNRWFLDPLFHGRYPADMLDLFAEYLPPVRDGDLRQMQAPLDYLGINCYRRSVIAQGTELPPVSYRRVAPSGEYTTMGWEVYPPAIYDILRYVHEGYHPPALYVTENGAAFRDIVSSDGYVHDEQRVRYLGDHLVHVRRALDDGVPVKGYFVWSLLDNFEWAHGYDQRFGIVYVDYPTQRRIIKDSGYFLRDVIAGAAYGNPE